MTSREKTKPKTKPLSGKIPGALLIIASLELVFSVLLAQNLYPNYNLNTNYISDLGVGSTSVIFNSAIQVFGLLLLLSAYFMIRAGGNKYIALLFAVVGIGGFCVGTFPETTGNLHRMAALVAFFPYSPEYCQL